ncbi:MAG TPA: hypothetical protein VE869_07180 [Gemmatimonas sp.]|nr:hypothetical protein [Gemmatimonas sp.]
MTMAAARLTLGRLPTDERLASACELRDHLHAQTAAVSAMVDDWATRDAPVSFKDFEKSLREIVFAFARVAIMLFLAVREQRVMRDHPPQIECNGRRFRRAPAIARSLATMFGIVRYARTYLREIGPHARHGFHPLDVSLGLCGDRFSWNVFTMAARLATKLSFAEARATLSSFVPDAPSTEVIEQTVLGLGRHTAGWFAQVPAPEGDGEVLVIMIDSKGAPTATASELSRRRGKRRRRRTPLSPRHRGRHRRRRWDKKPRRKKGDKSKNARMATMVVMFTLRRNGNKLLGPINKRLYASFAPKRHAFEIARRDAAKRGFGPGSDKLVQIVTDGDLDFDAYVTEYFPTAMHTMDVMHVIEKLWSAGECLYREGTQPLREWFDAQKDRLYTGEVEEIIAELCQRRHAIPVTGPGNKGKRARLFTVIRYLDKRVSKMPYAKLIALELELGTGAVEGAVKNIIGKRCDHGGMRWIRERVEAIVQLRCIEANGDWDRFATFVHDRMRSAALRDGERLRLQSSTPAALPALLVAA